MADNKCYSYSFYVPANDQKLCEFLEAQSNLSMSIRFVLKAFMANYGEDGIPDITTMDLKTLLNNMAITPETIEKMSVKKVEVKSVKSEVKKEKIIEPETEVETEPETEKETEPETEPETTSEPEIDTSEIDTTEDIVPDVEVEPEVPKKTVNSSRDAYNSKQNASKDASIDDVMSLMGEM